MCVIIQTGFGKVNHRILFQPETESKGKRFVNANHVCNVEEFRDNGTSFMIRALVIKQTSVSSPPYKTNLNVNYTTYLSVVFVMKILFYIL